MVKIPFISIKSSKKGGVAAQKISRKFDGNAAET